MWIVYSETLIGYINSILETNCYLIGVKLLFKVNMYDIISKNIKTQKFVIY